ncbi:hypothetical protein A4H97_05245 [Niastella yeongjuensis]|uniref:Outer membrane protein beta-barrel domain-containing protein n=1 Tax=Niastella yeongjuensis TaxID=354355 RepID=A0A1V9ELD0_9BACT|nr:hypothetical protein [Niastella yeongjuensis]OQP46926.1 hypothetical protein A4H97_05245 [Niastella yeongjuensis]SEN60938.1 hypothetical protein SAMN05660816_01072 [Niastella yeongjuensis]
MKFAVRCLTVVTLVLIAGRYNSAQAQKLFFIFAHGQYASPMQASFKHDYDFGLGAEAGVGIGFGSKTFLTGTIGYSVFKAQIKELGNVTFVPMKLGFRRYFLPANLLFIHADAGVAHIKDKTTNATSSRFSGDVGAGIKLGPFEVGVAYDGFAREEAGYASWLAFKAGWRFGL